MRSEPVVRHGEYAPHRNSETVACLGKFPYPSAHAAMRGATRHRQGAQFDAYRCRFCHSYHLAARRKRKGI